MSEMKPKLEIRVEQDQVNITLDRSVFKLSANERSLPEFRDSVRKELPDSIPEIIVDTMKQMKRDGRNQAHVYLDVLHEYDCAELAGNGTCDCDPVLRDSSRPKLEVDWEQLDYGKLTCIVCDESSIGGIVWCGYAYNDTALWQRYRTTGKDNNRSYWAFSSKTLICEDCVINFMAKIGVRFRNVNNDSSPDSNAEMVQGSIRKQ